MYAIKNHICRIAEIFGVKLPRLLELEKETQMVWKDLIKISAQRQPSKQVFSVDEISASIDDLKVVNRQKDNFIATANITQAVVRLKQNALQSFDDRLEAIQAVEISAGGVSCEKIRESDVYS